MFVKQSIQRPAVKWFIGFIVILLFIVMINPLFAAQDAPRITIPQAQQQPPVNAQGPTPSESQGAAPAETTVSKPWSTTTWVSVIVFLFFTALFVITLILYKKEKKVSDGSRKAKILKYILVFIPPAAYLVVLIIALGARVYTHTIDPILFSFKIKSVNIRIAYYGVVYALGFVIAYIWMRYEIKYKNLDFKPEELDTFFIYGCIGIVLGARVFEALFYVEPWYNFFWWKEGFKSWSSGWKFIKIYEGGLSAHGGIMGLVVAAVLFARKRNKSFYSIMDIAVLPSALALALGRFANYINGELYGIPTGGDWGVIFAQAAQPGVTNMPRIPTQLFESLKNLLAFSILFAFRKRLNKPGLLAWGWVFLYGLFRFIIELWKDYAILWKMGDLNFTMGNILCLAMIGASSFMIYNIYKGDAFVAKSDDKVIVKHGKKKKRKK